MYNPQYTTRFGVIMEAYLKGCGESMLKQFEDQVEMQTTLERIGMEVCDVCVCVCVCCHGLFFFLFSLLHPALSQGIVRLPIPINQRDSLFSDEEKALLDSG